MAAPVKVVLGSIAFGIFWVLAVFPAVPFLPIGRTAGSLLGAMLMVIFRVIPPEEAYDAIDLPILGLLFGTMVVSVFLEKADMFKYLGKMLSWKSRGGKDLLVRICLVSAVSSALFTNDTCCVVLTEFILKLARQNNLPPQPFLLALASSSNIGSAATPIGNPQNLVIAVQSGISFEKFLAGLFPAVLLGGLLNAAILLCYFWKLLAVDKDEEVASAVGEVVAEDDMTLHRFSPATMSHVASLNSQEFGSSIEAFARSPSLFGEFAHISSVRSRANSIDIDVQTASNVGIESMRASAASRDAAEGAGLAQREEGTSSRRVSRTYSSQRCVSRGGEASLQASDSKESSMEMWKSRMWKACVYLVTIGMLISLLMGLNMSWTAITAALVLVVLDFKDACPCLEKEMRAWLILAWVSTVAGNLSLLGSAANLIVCEQARRVQYFAYNLSFLGHLRFGVPSTLLVTGIGLFLVRSY
ncbi:hypothetical protein BHE74_00045889 [Ensete ventricosum]|nr:hypothetical protein BHE74_00045889 [Ensete ventricosum]